MNLTRAHIFGNYTARWQVLSVSRKVFPASLQAGKFFR